MKLEFDGYMLNGERLAGAPVLDDELKQAENCVTWWETQIAQVKAVTADPVVIGNFENRLPELKAQANHKRQCLIQVLTMDLKWGNGRRFARLAPYRDEPIALYQSRIQTRIAELKEALDA